MIGASQVVAVAQRGRAGRVSHSDRRGRSQRPDLDRHLPAGGVVHGVREDRGIGAAGAFLDHTHREALHALHRTHPRAEDGAHAGAILIAELECRIGQCLTRGDDREQPETVHALAFLGPRKSPAEKSTRPSRAPSSMLVQYGRRVCLPQRLHVGAGGGEGAHAGDHDAIEPRLRRPRARAPARAKTTEALAPPNAKLFDRAISISMARGPAVM